MYNTNLKEQILQYESKIFENYINKRKQLIENIENTTHSKLKHNSEK
jgi:hypothetical protein